MYIDVYKDDDTFATSGAKLLSDLDLQETYKAIDSVATGRIPSLFCGLMKLISILLFKYCHNCAKFIQGSLKLF